MRIRKAAKKDLSEIAELMITEYFKHYKEKWTKKNALKTLNYFFKVCKTFVVEENKKVVGFVIVREEHYNEGKSAMVEELVVEGKQQGKGIGKQLMLFVENYCKKNKIKQIWLITGKKAAAFRFYKAIGYTYKKDVAYFSKEV